MCSSALARWHNVRDKPTSASHAWPCQSLHHGSCRNNTEFLPAALVIGLQPGVPLLIPIVVVAEDGVTSQRYYVAGMAACANLQAQLNVQ